MNRSRSILARFPHARILAPQPIIKTAARDRPKNRFPSIPTLPSFSDEGPQQVLEHLFSFLEALRAKFERLYT